ncbi:unnamed protein product [Spirodela intermedia]|uniref:Uncharacterized protein n=1 Tax=Spirodela intermedia TaxID=51605 RepID=A0A7I8L2S8_SPIIN|nr:unnamed protein product [Spirodela intermedia]
MLKQKSDAFKVFKQFKTLLIGLKWIFKVKKNPQGEIIRHKWGQVNYEICERYN